MTYVMSDIHGRYDKYKKMLKEINFNDKDDLYVIGDMIDIGTRSVDVLKDMSMRANVFPILGDHEYLALKIIKKAEKSHEENSELSEMLDKWMSIGGKTTADELALLDKEEREALIEYLEDLPLYEELSVNGRKYILVHAGLGDFSANRELADYSPEELVFEKVNMNRRYFDDATLISGHTVIKDGESYQNKAVHANGNIAINCGEDEDQPLCAICLDNGQEYYV